MPDLTKLLVGQPNSFYDDYEFLNKLSYSPTTLKNIQVREIKRYYRKDNMVKKINAFFNQCSALDAEGESKAFQREVVGNSISQVIRVLNTGLYHGDADEGAFKRMIVDQKKHGLDVDYDKIEKEIEKLRNALSNITDDTELINNIIELYNIQIMGRGSKANNPEITRHMSKSGRKVIDNYNTWKWKMVEKIVSVAINKNSTLRAIQTGQMKINGKDALQDILSFDKNDNRTFSKAGLITYEIKGSQHTIESKGKSLLDILNEIDKLNKSNISFSVNDELYDELLLFNEMSIQVKSHGAKGESFSILNKGKDTGSQKRNSITLREIGAHKHPLVRLSYMTKRIDENAVSDSLGELANYFLAKNILQTNAIGNDLVATRDGLMTVEEWMQKTNHYLRFNSDINTWEKFKRFDYYYNYNFYNVNSR